LGSKETEMLKPKKRKGGSSSFLSKSPPTQRRRKIDESMEQTKEEIKIIFQENPLPVVEDTTVRSAIQLVQNRLVDSVVEALIKCLHLRLITDLFKPLITIKQDVVVTKL
jgi:hypothetical protein